MIRWFDSLATGSVYTKLQEKASPIGDEIFAIIWPYPFSLFFDSPQESAYRITVECRVRSGLSMLKHWLAKKTSSILKSQPSQKKQRYLGSRWGTPIYFCCACMCACVCARVRVRLRAWAHVIFVRSCNCVGFFLSFLPCYYLLLGRANFCDRL